MSSLIRLKSPLTKLSSGCGWVSVSIVFGCSLSITMFDKSMTDLLTSFSSASSNGGTPTSSIKFFLLLLVDSATTVGSMIKMSLTWVLLDEIWGCLIYHFDPIRWLGVWTASSLKHNIQIFYINKMNIFCYEFIMYLFLLWFELGLRIWRFWEFRLMNCLF